MNRRQLILSSTALGVSTLAMAESRTTAAAGTSGAPSQPGPPLPVPQTGSIPVAFLISDGAVVIDFCGPWEVFQDVSVPGRSDNAFELYTVAETTKPIQASAGMKIVPDYAFASAPAP